MQSGLQRPMSELYYAKSALVGFIVSNIAFMIYVATAGPGHRSDQILAYGLMAPCSCCYQWLLRLS
jgi:hypothetical protein